MVKRKSTRHTEYTKHARRYYRTTTTTTQIPRKGIPKSAKIKKR